MFYNNDKDICIVVLTLSNMRKNKTPNIDKFIGIAINFPNTEKEESYYIVNATTNYTELDFYSATKWGDFLLE